jgi:hypothetical protein
MIREITNESQRLKLKTEFLKVFKGIDPFHEVFNDAVVERLIIYPTDGYYLTPEQFEALLNAANIVGDSEIYISEVESESDCFTAGESDRKYQCKHWVVENQIQLNQYYELPIVLENAIYSPQGKWGIIISHEEHALLGGMNEFMKYFKASYNKWNEDTESFIVTWESNKKLYDSNLDWLPKILRHINQNEEII